MGWSNGIADLRRAGRATCEKRSRIARRQPADPTQLRQGGEGAPAAYPQREKRGDALARHDGHTAEERAQ